jgi:transcriptional regulator with XRE-family HTH domain
MSHFSNALQAILEKKRLTQTRVCQRTEISQSQLSRYVNGQNRPERGHLEKLLSLFDEEERATLLVARLRDILPRSLRNLVTIKKAQRAHHREEPTSRFSAHAPRELREALEYLAEAAIENPDAAKALIALAQILRAK